MAESDYILHLKDHIITIGVSGKDITDIKGNAPYELHPFSWVGASVAYTPCFTSVIPTPYLPNVGARSLLRGLRTHRHRPRRAILRRQLPASVYVCKCVPSGTAFLAVAVRQGCCTKPPLVT